MQKFISFPLFTSFNTFFAYSTICKKLALFTGEDLLVQTFVTTLFTLSLGVGSLLWDKSRQSRMPFEKAQISLTFFYMLLPFLLLGSDFLINVLNWTWYLPAGLFTMLLGTLSGFEIPFYLKYLKQTSEKTLFLNYTGTLIASLLFISLLGTGSILDFSLIFVALINAFVLHFFLPKPKSLLLFSLTIVLFMPYLSLSGLKSDLKKMIYLRFEITNLTDLKNLYSAVKKSDPIYTYSSPYQEIDIVSEGIYYPNKPEKSWGLFLNRKVQFFSDSEIIYHQTMAYTPLLYHPKPQKVLILGGGDLGLIRELSRISGIENLKLVELDPTIIELATEGPFLNQLHHKKYNFELIEQDAFSFLLNSKEQFDIIYADFPFPNNYDLLKLYSLEFYQLAKQHLTGNGVFIFDFPFAPFNSLEHKKSQAVLIKTLKKAGFKSHIWGRTETFVLNTKNHITRRPLNSINKFLSNKALTNFVHQTDHFKFDLSHAKVNSIFKPVKRLYLDP